MARRRGFFAELQHQAAVAERNRQRAQATSQRDRLRRQREAARAKAAAVRARAAADRADTRSRAEAEREAKRLHIEAREAEVDAMNGELSSQLEEIDSVLTATLVMNHRVELASLHQVAEHPPFTSAHQEPTPAFQRIEAPPKPQYEEPIAPSGMAGFLKRKEYRAAVDRQTSAYETWVAQWSVAVALIPARQEQLVREYQAKERDRTSKLAAERAIYEAGCRQRQSVVDADNAELADLIARYAAGQATAVEECCAVAFNNSVYPDLLNFGLGLDFSAEDAELEIVLTFPRPDELPVVKAFKYVKAKDEVAATNQTLKEQRDRYAGLIHNMVLRTMHEMWESDRAGHISTISLTGGVDHIDPATGLPTTTQLVAVAAARHEFDELDLSRVAPMETLKHLNAVVSRNPHALTPISTPDGIRG